MQHQLKSKQTRQETIQRFHDEMRMLDMGHREHRPPHENREPSLSGSSSNMKMLEGEERHSFSRAKIFLKTEDLDIYRDQGYLYYVHKNPTWR